jgi:hypothetical protein
MNELEKAESRVSALTSERDRILARLDSEQKQAEAKGDHQTAEEKRLKWLETNARYNGLIDKYKGQRDQAKAARDAWQAEQDAKAAKAAQHAENLAKSQARTKFQGTSSEFEAAWPAIWNEVRQRRAVAAVSDRPGKTFEF